MSAPRVPSLWVVLLPALALVALGARAVVAETRAEEARVRDRAAATAARLARSLRGAMDEYTPVPTSGDPGATPDDGSAASPGGIDAALDGVRHLFPRWVGLRGGATAAVAAGDPAGGDDDPSRGFVRDAEAAVARIGDDAAGRAAGVAFLHAAADAAPTPWARDLLRLAAAARDPEAGGVVASSDGARLPPEAAGVARAACVRAEKTGDDRAVVVSADGGELHVGVVRAAVLRGPGNPGDAVRVHVGGEVPASVLRDRVGGEARALIDGGGAVSVALVAPDGTRTLGASTAFTGAVVVEAVTLGAPFDGWRVEAAAAAPAGVPSSAVALGLAGVLAAAALLAGTVALRRAVETQRRIAEERQTFLDHVAHEVRTPAAALLALSEELASGNVAPDRAPVYHAHLETEARRLARLVEDTLDLSRLDAGRLVFAATPLDLRDVAREGAEAVAAGAAGERPRVRLRLGDAAVPVRGDAAALRRVVKNLVDNAVRHGGGAEPVEVEVRAEGGGASVIVRDRGRGIAPEHLPRLFERFYRVPSATHEAKGVGLGLALCREVARSHGGDVSAESVEGRGSSFVLRLPLAGGGAA